MNRESVKWIGFVCLTLLISTSSCRKDKDQVLDTIETKNESVNSFVDKNLSSDEEAISLKNMLGGSNNPCGWTGYFSSCAEISEDSENFPKTITIDFGDGCLGPGGYTRSGIMYVHLTGPMDEVGSIRTVTFSDYSINNVQISGSRITTFTNTNDSGNPVFSRLVDTYLTYDGNTFHRNFSSEITWIAGYNTDACGDNDWKITGSGTSTRPDGTVVSRTITSPLYHYHTCYFITQGIMQVLAPAGTITINYGNGVCDDLASVTGPNGNTFTVDLNP